MKRALFFLLLLAAGFSAYGYYTYTTTEFVPEVATIGVTEGDIVDTVGATGALEAVTTVQVGSQVSGIIQELYVDYNSIVRKDDVIMRLDPSLFQTQIEQARANLVRAEADVERWRVSVDDARMQLVRAEGLAERNLISETELEAAQVAVRSAEAQLKSSEAQVTQARAALNQNEVNLEHTVIRAPIDGIVISRLVDIGQTVAASLQAPELFVIAADLTKMRVIANIDESDVGRIRPGQRVTFTVDAYPAEEFVGTVSQIRLEPIVTQNVVTYATVIDAPNNDLKLKPGMTATVSLEIARRENVVRIPNSALRFRPSPEMFAGLNQPVPPFLQQGGAGRAAPDPGGVAAPPSGPGGEGPAAGFAGPGGGFGGRGGTRDPERMRQFQERTAQVSPEGQEQFMAQRRGRGGAGGGAGAQRRRASVSSEPAVPTVERGASTIDALFAPLPPVETTGRVWVMRRGHLQAINVRLGVTDGTASELLGVMGGRGTARRQETAQIATLRQQVATLEDGTARTELEQTLARLEAQSGDSPEPPAHVDAGTQLVTNVTTPEDGSAPPSAIGGSPLIPQFGRGRRR